MTSIAFIGDCTTTTTLAVAAAWPIGTAHLGRPTGGAADPSDVCVVECDPHGGSLAGWLSLPETPSMSTAVTALHQMGGLDAHRTARSALDPLIRTSRAGPRVLTAPFRAREARTAVAEATRGLLPLLGTSNQTVALLDVGRSTTTDVLRVVGDADPIIVTHRQDASSAGAAAVRIERLAETFELLRAAGHDPDLAVIGDDPFPVMEIASLLELRTAPHSMPVDPLTATSLAGRSGVSARRLNRLPLMRAAAELARRLHDEVTQPRADRSIEVEPAS